MDSPSALAPSTENSSRQQPVHTTISRDFAGGKLARESTILRSLGFKTTETTSKASSRLTSAVSEQKPASQPQNRIYLAFSPRDLKNQTGPNHALQDYQTKLMLLEQQNKKRLMFTREEPEILDRKAPNKPMTEITALKKNLLAEPIPELGTAWPPRMDANEAKRPLVDDIQDQSHGQMVKKAKLSHASSRGRNVTAIAGSSAHTDLADSSHIASKPFSPRGNSRAKPAAGSVAKPTQSAQSSGNVHYRTLHQVVCRSHFHTSKGKIFTDHPTWLLDKSKDTFDTRAHLSGQHQVHNIADFISNAGNISFIIFRYYRCSEAARWDSGRTGSRTNDSIRFDEAIGMVSRRLQEAMDRLSRCVSDPGSYYPKTNSSIKNDKANADDFEPDEYTMDYFYHHRGAIDMALDQAEGDLQIQLGALQTYIDSQYGPVFRETDTLAAEGMVRSHEITRLFCPNEILITKSTGVPTACVLRAWPTKGNMIGLECWNWGYDGHWLHRKKHTLVINRPIQPLVSIRDLEAYPLRFATEEEVRTLEMRGRKFWSLRYQSFVAYEGWDFKAEQFYASSFSLLTTESILTLMQTNESRWMIDYKTYRQMHPNAEPFHFGAKQKVLFDSWPEVISHKSELDPPNLVILPSLVHGFSLKKKDWHSLLIDNIKQVKWNKEAFERLVLPDRIKDMVKSLVMVRASGRGSKNRQVLDNLRDDLIAGKGHGLIMLLHGGPGTGKTLTAESVAELAEMPLYSVTCGDIGTKPEIVEEYLETVLMLGKRWNCVLLLDEADVFLEERSLADLERNSLVSVFLRTLEYYDGILILTSNRIGTFDAAFTSRIQVALHYDKFTPASRRKIWQNFFNMLDTDEEDVDLENLSSHLNDLVDHDMNGRQIRNVFTTARQLAIFKKEKLVWDHLEQAIKCVGDFNTYLRRLHGHSEEDWVRDEKLR